MGGLLERPLVSSKRWPDERIPCSRNPAHIGGNSAAAAIELDDAVLAELEAVMQLGPAFA
jgi:hypothetical protein